MSHRPTDAAVDLRNAFNAILHANRTGIPWKYLPHDFPNHDTVYACYAAWRDGGYSASSTTTSFLSAPAACRWARTTVESTGSAAVLGMSVRRSWYETRALNTVKRFARAGKPERMLHVSKYRAGLADSYREHLRERRPAAPPPRQRQHGPAASDHAIF
ncbi:hypothetical protein GCM10018966_075820 [Streptomyces yanii]